MQNDSTRRSRVAPAGAATGIGGAVVLSIALTYDPTDFGQQVFGFDDVFGKAAFGAPRLAPTSLAVRQAPYVVTLDSLHRTAAYPKRCEPMFPKTAGQPYSPTSGEVAVFGPTAEPLKSAGRVRLVDLLSVDTPSRFTHVRSAMQTGHGERLLSSSARNLAQPSRACDSSFS